MRAFTWWKSEFVLRGKLIERGIFTGLPYGNPSRKVFGICSVFVFFFSSVSVKVLPVTPLVSGGVHRAFCAYFLRIERVVELRRFLWWQAKLMILLCPMASKVM